MQQQTELIRQQTEALRQQNESQNQGSLAVSVPIITTAPPKYLFAAAYAAVPKPTGKKKVDQNNWKLWLIQYPLLDGLVSPAWSRQEYDRVHTLAIQQAIAGN
jgi:hypothetical protein